MKRDPWLLAALFERCAEWCEPASDVRITAQYMRLREWQSDLYDFASILRCEASRIERETINWFLSPRRGPA